MRGISILICFLALACQTKKEKAPLVIEEVSLEGSGSKYTYPQWLSEWSLFQEPINSLQPNKGIFEYELNSPLFSDYANKARFIKIPMGTAITYNPSETFEFPTGTILIKNFFYEKNDQRDLKETRLLINGENGWDAVTYVWNEDQTDAELTISGTQIPTEFTDNDGLLQNVDYSVPNLVQCKSCHEKSGKLMPIGPTARQLNRDNADGVNQLVEWESEGMLNGLPDQSTIPQLVGYENPKAALDRRARAWLEINCAHCHRAEGPAKNTGLYLMYKETDPYKLGVMKPPVAAGGRGSGGLHYSIVPGKPDESILFYRISSLDPGIMMPEVGRKLNHEEGIELIREWISSMDQEGKIL